MKKMMVKSFPELRAAFESGELVKSDYYFVVDNDATYLCYCGDGEPREHVEVGHGYHSGDIDEIKALGMKWHGA